MNWPLMLRRAVMELRLSPEQFWRMSWREWVWLNPPAVEKSLLRHEVTALMDRFPDKKNEPR